MGGGGGGGGEVGRGCCATHLAFIYCNFIFQVFFPRWYIRGLLAARLM